MAIVGHSPRWATLCFVPVGLLSAYVLFLALILHPTFQAHNVFLHGINIPFHYDLTRPDSVRGIGKGKARNVRLRTSDDVSIAAWHIVPDEVTAPHSPADFDRSLRTSPVVLYFHGNAMNRAAPIRVGAYKHFTSLGLNVVAIDYRGFGDSDGTPTEEGLLRDARAAYRWVLERQRAARQDGDAQDDAQSILLSGQSLGTGVASRLTLDLVEAGHAPPAVLLLAPYMSIRQLLTSYRIGGVVPLFWPLGLSQQLSSVADKYLYTRFESDKALYVAARGGSSRLDDEERKQIGEIAYQLSPQQLRAELGLEKDSGNLTAPHIVIAHADDDGIIPHTQGRGLFDRIHDALAQHVDEARSIDIKEHTWGEMLTLSRASNEAAAAQVTLIKSRKGGHNGVPRHALEYFVNVAAAGRDAPATGERDEPLLS